ncbi:MAG: DUF4375 domain-containing protein [Cyanobacteria bacterium SZAS-4]|nr:DUF4375 domain-containing protein [Cyanobacteria bacterium SZAS-4]
MHNPPSEILTHESLTIFYTKLFVREVLNGGFFQFMANSAGNNTAETLNALIEIGANFSADLLRQAVNLFPRSLVPVNKAERVAILSEPDLCDAPQWDALSQIFWDQVSTDKNSSAPVAENIWELMHQFICDAKECPILSISDTSG